MFFDCLMCSAHGARAEGETRCFFLRAAADYPHKASIRHAALSHKQEYFALVERRLRLGGWSSSQVNELAPVIFLLLEGAVAAAFVLGDDVAVTAARRAAALLLDSSRSSPL